MCHFDIVQNKDHLLVDYCKYPMILLMPVMGILLQLIRQNHPLEVHNSITKKSVTIFTAYRSILAALHAYKFCS